MFTGANDPQYQVENAHHKCLAKKKNQVTIKTLHIHTINALRSLSAIPIPSLAEPQLAQQKPFPLCTKINTWVL